MPEDTAKTAENPKGKDPTENVRELMGAAVQRLDDLRNAEIRRLKDVMDLTSNYSEKLVAAEAKRIDAIRAVDVNAVAVASERAAQQALVLANQVSASAETLRLLVASTATQLAAQLAQTTAQLTERTASLEKAQYEGVGNRRVTDPQLTELMQQVRDLNSSRSRVEGRTGVSAPLMMMMASLVGGLIVYLIQKGL